MENILFIFRNDGRDLEAEALILNPRIGVFATTDIYLYGDGNVRYDRRDDIVSKAIAAKLGTVSFNDYEFRSNKTADKIRNNIKYALGDIYFLYSKNKNSKIPADGHYYLYEFFYDPFKNDYINGDSYKLPKFDSGRDCGYGYAEEAKKVYTYFK